MNLENLKKYFSNLFKEPIFIFYSVANNLKHLKNKKRNIIKKEFKKLDISKVMIPPEIKVDKEKVYIEGFNDEKIAAMITNFTIKMQLNFSKEDLTFFYRNVNNINVHQVITDFSKLLFSLIKSQNINGIYLAGSNSISINKECLDSSLYHEIFHMATAYSEKEKTFCGFAQGYLTSYDEANYDNFLILGKALNEGYTEIMNNRYFNIDISKSGYAYYIDMASKIEKIVGTKFMEKQYMHANLKGLIEELAKYSSIEDTINFIKNMDFYHMHIRDKRKIPYEKRLLKKCKRDCALFIINAYINKIKMDYNNKNIFVYDALMEIDKFINEFLNNSNFNHYLTKEDQKRIIKNIKKEFNIYNEEELRYAYYRDSML